MILDRSLLLSDAQAITATAASTNQIDIGAAGIPMFATGAPYRDVGRGSRIPFLVQVLSAFAAAGAGTLVVSLQTDEDVAFGSAKTVWTSAVIAKTDLVPGYRFGIDYLPKGMDERYFRLMYTVATGPFTAGTITASVDMGNDDRAGN